MEARAPDRGQIRTRRRALGLVRTQRPTAQISLLPGGPEALAPLPALDEYAGAWWERWRAAGRWHRPQDPQRHLALYVLPELGRYRLDQLRPARVTEWHHGLLSTTSRRGRPLAPRTALHALRTLIALYDDALEELDDPRLLRNPARIRHPVPSRDAPGWDRRRRAFTSEEASTVLGCPLIPVERRVLYALELFTGARFGELAALRWRDLEPRGPLWCLHLWRSWDSAGQGAEGRGTLHDWTKTGVDREVPVHPTLWRILAVWATHHYPALYQRQAAGEALIIPRRITRGERRGEVTHRDASASRHQQSRDLALAGIRDLRQHDWRKTLATLAPADGADREVIERLTHLSRRDQFARYMETHWSRVCAEITKLRIPVPEWAR